MSRPDPSPDAPPLEIAGASVCQDGVAGRVRVREVDWLARPGEFWVIGGPPESGKTDLLATAAGLQRPSSGSVKLFGYDTSDLAEADLLPLRTRIGFVFKNGGGMFPDLTVEDSIALPLRYHHNAAAGEAAEKVRPLLELTELSAEAHRSPPRLGSSMQPRVALARALAMRPDILFLDEPFAGLGWRHRQWWLDTLEKLAAGSPFTDGRKIAVVATTNDFALFSGRRAHFAAIKDQRWQTLGEQTDPPLLQ